MMSLFLVCSAAVMKTAFSGCFHWVKFSLTGWLIHSRNLCLIVLESVKFKVKALVDLVSGESLPSGSLTAVFSLCPHMAEGQGSALGLLL